MTETLNVLLIEDDPDYATLVQTWLASAKTAKLIVNWTDTLLQGVERIAGGGIDVILLDLGLPDSQGAETFHAAYSHAPHIPIILLSAASNESLAMEIVHAGAQDYLVKENCTQDTLVRALNYAVLRQRSRPDAVLSPRTAAMIGVLPVKGGLGATTFACTLAAELRRQTQQETLLIDFDLHSNAVAFLLGLDARYTIADVLANAGRLDRTIWDSIVCHGPENLHVLASSALYGRPHPPVEALRRVLNRIRVYYSWIVLDLGRLNEDSQILLQSLQQVVVLTSTSVSSLYQANQMISALQERAPGLDTLKLVAVNLAGEKAIPEASLRTMLPLPLTGCLPCVTADVEEAATRKELPAAGSRYRDSIASLARGVAGLPEQKPRSALKQLLSFGGIRVRTAQGNPV